jgi:hypothetical protein
VGRRLARFVALAALVAAAPAGADPREVFRRFADRVVQVRILNPASESKSALGSGFVVGDGGLIVTNYHVVAEVVQHPDRYRAELVGAGGEGKPLALLDIDVVHDLAVVRSDVRLPPPLELDARPLDKGTRLYSLGNPLDLGFTIVEGTYNGLIEESIYEKIHFTGSINPGMSGGPAITARGAVVGVNVSTAGNQVSFLVPVKYVQRLVAETTRADYRPPADFLALARAQLLANQEDYVARILAAPLERTQLGRWRLPGRLAGFFKCWGDSERRDDLPYETVRYGCSTEDRIYISEGQSSSQIEYRHTLYSTDSLNVFRFFSLYQASFAERWLGLRSASDDVGRFTCSTRFVDHEQALLKVVLCVRAYKKLAGLYDAILKAATLNENRAGVETTLRLSGVTFENAERFARSYLEAIAWTP